MDRLLALARGLLVGLTAAALYLILVQERMPGDSSALVAAMARTEAGTGPALRRAVLTGRDPKAVLRLLADALDPQQQEAA